MQRHRPRANMEYIKNARAQMARRSGGAYMAAIVTVINKITPAGVFAVCPFLLCCSLLCPTWAPAGAGISPLPVAAKVSALENGQRASCTHGELFCGADALRIMRSGCANRARTHHTAAHPPHACGRGQGNRLLTADGAYWHRPSFARLGMGASMRRA